MKLKTVILLFTLTTILTALAGLLFYYDSNQQAALKEARLVSATHLETARGALAQLTAQYDHMTLALSRQRALARVLQDASGSNLEQANHVLDIFNTSLLTSVCYLLDAAGRVIASSNRLAADSFVGKNYAFRPYFKRALKGEPAVYLARGVTSGLRGIYFSRPVFAAASGKIAGAAVIKVDVHAAEQVVLARHYPTHVAHEDRVMIVNPEGLIFIADDPALLFHFLWPVDAGKLNREALTKQFGPGPWSWAGFTPEGADRAVDAAGRHYDLLAASIAALPGWQIMHMNDIDAIAAQNQAAFWKTVGFVFGFVITIVAAALFVLNFMARKAEKTLRVSEARYRSVTETVTEGIILQAASGEILTWNRGAEDIFGIPAREVIGKNTETVEWPTLYTDGSKYEGKDHPSLRTLRTGQPCRNELMGVLRPSGELRWISINTNPLYNEDEDTPSAVAISFADITDLKKEKDLSRQYLDIAGAMLLALDATGHITLVNKRACRILESSEEDLLGLNWFDNFLPPAIADDVKEIFQSLMHGNADPVKDVVGDIVTRSGNIRTMAWHNAVLKDDSGRNTGTLSSGEDITERKRIEKERKNYHERVQSLWRVARMTEAGHRELCDLVLEQIQKLTGSQYSFFGFLEADEQAMVIHTWSHDAMDDCAVPQQPIHFAIDKAGLWSQAVIDRKPLLVNDYSRAHPRKRGLPEGHVALKNLLSVPIVRQGKVVALAAVANKPGDYSDEDVSQVEAFVANVLLLIEKRASEELLRSREELLNEMGSIARIGGWEHDLVTRKATWTQEVYRIIEIDSGDVPGPDEHLDYYAPKDREILKDAYQKAVETGEHFDLELQCHSAKGRPLWVRAIGHPVFEDGRCVKIRGTFQDITDIKKMEEGLRQAQKMESIGTLAGGIAHDFNNLLFPIVGMSELLLEDLTPGSQEYENAEEIFKAGKRGGELVKQILAFSRQSEHKLVPVRVQKILKEVLNLIRATIPANIELAQVIQSDCGIVLADPIQVHQVAMNLITNAYHAVEASGGRITVELGATRLEKEDLVDRPLQPGQYARLSITDNGTGIDPQVMDKIFEPYFTTKAQQKGTGLGLSVAYGIVREHGGEIKVYSEIGKGTTFDVYLPFMEKTTEAAEEAIVIHPTGTERILLVDDEAAIVRIEGQMLERLGYQVTFRTSSLEALEAFRAKPDAYDLVITDMTMPNLTGDQLARELISIRPDIPIIACTGFSDRINAEKAAAMGIRVVLKKPIIKAQIARAVRDALDAPEGQG